MLPYPRNAIRPGLLQCLRHSRSGPRSVQLSSVARVDARPDLVPPGQEEHPSSDSPSSLSKLSLDHHQQQDEAERTWCMHV